VRCGSCHRPGGEAGVSAMDLTIDAPEDAMGLCGVAPSADFPGLANVRLVDPKRPETSLLHLRMVDEGSLAMPPGRRTADREGAALVAEWIRSGAACAARSG